MMWRMLGACAGVYVRITKTRGEQRVQQHLQNNQLLFHCFHRQVRAERLIYTLSTATLGITLEIWSGTLSVVETQP